MRAGVGRDREGLAVTIIRNPVQQALRGFQERIALRLVGTQYGAPALCAAFAARNWIARRRARCILNAN
jgi:hypothetical protein